MSSASGTSLVEEFSFVSRVERRLLFPLLLVTRPWPSSHLFIACFFTKSKKYTVIQIKYGVGIDASGIEDLNLKCAC